MNVRFYLNGVYWADGNWNGQGYTGYFPNMRAGTYSIAAVVTDGVYNEVKTSAPLSITVSPNSLPTVSLVTPAAGSTVVVPAPIDLSANAADTDHGVSTVRFYRDGVYFLEAGNRGNGVWGNVWNGAAPGTYVITAGVTDHAGATTMSAPHTVTVAQSVAPTAVITSPANGATFALPPSWNPTTFTIEAQVADSDGWLNQVRVYRNGIHQKDIGHVGNGVFRGNLDNVPAGTWSFTVVAVDNAGLATTSMPISITVLPNKPPTISITGPVVPPRAGVNFNITGIADDPDGYIQRIEVFADGRYISDAGYSYTNKDWWRFFGVENGQAGTYVITAVAYDSVGQSTFSAPFTLHVVGSTPPTVSITSPSTGGATIIAPATIPLAATAADADGTIRRVRFYHGEEVLDQGTLTSGTSASGTYTSNAWSNVPAGTYTLVAEATDNSDAVTYSTPVTITVASSPAPTIQLTSPSNGGIYTAPASISLSATASAGNAAVSQVQFFNGAMPIGIGTLGSGNSSSGSYVYASWNNVTAGTYTITARVTDANNVIATSAPITFTIDPTPSGVTGGMYYIIADHLGTPRVVQNLTQNLVWSWEQIEPFGDSAPSINVNGPGSFDFSLRYPGQFHDSETSKYYNNFRDYDPTIGRYIQSDPIGLKGGINTFSYVGADPINEVDPFGLSALGSAGGVIGGIGGGVIGSVGGAAIGGAIGSLAGPGGTAAGGVIGGRIGGQVGAAGGQFVGSAAGEAMNSLIFNPSSSGTQAQSKTEVQDCDQRKCPMRTYHREESGSQTKGDAMLQISSSKMCGYGRRQAGGGVSPFPSVKAFPGPLPPGKRGIEFKTDICPASAQGNIIYWPIGLPGVIPMGDDMVCIPVTITTFNQL